MMIHYLSTLPFFVSVMWTVIFLLKWNQYSKGQKVFMPLAIACMIYYFCYDYYFSFGAPTGIVFFLGMSGLSIEPLYYYAVRKVTMTEKTVDWKFWLLLLPAAILPACGLFFDQALSQIIMRIIYLPLILYIYYKLITLTMRFSKKIHNSYADDENKSTLPIKISIVMMALTLVLNLTLRIIGIQNLSSTIICIALFYYSIALFIIFFVAGTYSFTAKEMAEEMGEETEEAIATLEETLSDSQSADVELSAKLEKLMDEEKLYLKNDLRITDVCLALSSNRTYVSRCIKKVHGVTFATYINSRRIAYAEQLMHTQGKEDLQEIALKSGFSTKQSFLRNYRLVKGYSI